MSFSRNLCSKCFQRKATRLAPPVNHISAAHISQTSRTEYPTKKKRVRSFPTTAVARSQTNFKEKQFYAIPLKGQQLRKPWEYPTQVDQYSNWKHKRWYDVLYKKWVETCPRTNKDFTITRKSQRKLIFEADNVREQLHLLLDYFIFRKYTVKTFDFEFPAPNLSYYYQYLTNTKYIHGMPYVIDHASVCDTYLAQLREFVNDILMIKHHKLSSSVQSPLSKHKLNEEIMSEIMTHLATTLAPSNPQLHACEVDHKAENSMFWLRGRGFLKWTLPEDLPVAFQCHDSPLLQIRTAEQLPEFTPHHGEFSCSGNIPTFHTTPHVFRNKRNVYRNSISPGHRAFGGDLDPSYQHAMDAEKLDEIAPPIYNPYPYGHTQLAILPAHYSRDWYSENMEHCDITEEIEEHIKGHGMMSGWVWTAAQAHYHRYWMDADVERPFSSQVIVTDGQFMSFFCYQLNTLAIDPDNMHDNPYRNLCYGSTDIKLYNDITAEGVTGLNDAALKMLIKFAMNGQLLHQSLSPRDEDIEEYNKTLPVQEPDAEYPDLEDQMPLHKARKAEQRQIEVQKREEEAYKQMTYTKRLTNMIGM